MKQSPSRNEAINVEQNLAETTQTPQGDTKVIDAWLKNLWDRAKKAAELIARLRAEKAELQARLASIEEELARVKQDLSKHEEMVRSLSAEQHEEDNSFLSNGEREELSARVKDLLTKLDGYV
ncbi:MAG TPA: hypothetical protein DGH68_04070 [Bacteroidetes bacterium]|jgi:hypothetical protein|nr:hypothetical protein [Bacteroidota bacterium]